LILRHLGKTQVTFGDQKSFELSQRLSVGFFFFCGFAYMGIGFNVIIRRKIVKGMNKMAKD
jgi:hypothetical protein